MNQHNEGAVALVVEESAVQRQHLVNVLHELGFAQVLQACDGSEALRRLGALDGAPLQLLITDVDMPDMDGIELLHRVAELYQVQHVVVVSAGDPRLLETVETLGRNQRALHLLGTLIKPITAPALRRILAMAPALAVNPVHDAGPLFGPAEIFSAVAAAQFVPHFQPQVDVATGLLKGVEALARWQHPQHGIIGPGAFIGVLEGSALMAAFTLQIVEQALSELVQWRRSMPGLTLSLNLAADSIGDQAFLDRLVGLCHAKQLPASAITWEVTETAIMHDRALANLARLRLKGFGLAMDDFGTGYSSILALARSPFTEIKIDRVFVNGASERNNRFVILSSALEMGRKLGVATLAEGVETEADWRILQQLGCGMAQGFLVAKPMPAAALLPWTRSSRNRVRQLALPPTPP